jgi:MFS family permease
VLAAAAGTAALIWVANPIVVIVSMALFGVGFGMAQNVTLTLMFERVPQSRFGQVSALWNLAYDGGMGIGAVAFALVAVRAGYPVGFALTGAVLFTALLPAWRDEDDQPAGDHVGEASAAGR